MRWCLLIILFHVHTIATAQHDSAAKRDNIPPTNVTNPADSLAPIHSLVKQKFPVKPLIAAAFCAGTYVVYRHADIPVRDFAIHHQNSFATNLDGPLSILGLGRTNSIGLVAAGAYSLIGRDKKLLKTSVIWAGSLIANSMITNQVKNTFQRHRPNTGDSYNAFDWRHGPGVNNSFFSAHTSNIFTTATVFATAYKNKKWVPYVSYGIATLTGLSRIYENAHWASDVLAGAFFGFMTAKGMFRVYNWGSKRFVITPRLGVHSASLDLVATF